MMDQRTLVPFLFQICMSYIPNTSPVHMLWYAYVLFIATGRSDGDVKPGGPLVLLEKSRLCRHRFSLLPFLTAHLTNHTLHHKTNLHGNSSFTSIHTYTYISSYNVSLSTVKRGPNAEGAIRVCIRSHIHTLSHFSRRLVPIRSTCSSHWFCFFNHSYYVLHYY